MIRFAPQAADRPTVPQPRATKSAAVSTEIPAENAFAPANPLLIPDLEEPAPKKTSGPRGPKKQKTNTISARDLSQLELNAPVASAIAENAAAEIAV